MISNLGLTIDNLNERLMQNRVPVYEDSPISEITPKGVYFYHNGYAIFLKADTVVLAVGVKPETKLAEELKQALTGVEIYMVGDCVEPRNAMAATSEASELVRRI